MNVMCDVLKNEENFLIWFSFPTFKVFQSEILFDNFSLFSSTWLNFFFAEFICYSSRYNVG